jgi:hypothetical protein
MEALKTGKPVNIKSTYNNNKNSQTNLKSSNNNLNLNLEESLASDSLLLYIHTRNSSSLTNFAWEEGRISNNVSNIQYDALSSEVELRNVKSAGDGRFERPDKFLEIFNNNNERSSTAGDELHGARSRLKTANREFVPYKVCYCIYFL